MIWCGEKFVMFLRIGVMYVNMLNRFVDVSMLMLSIISICGCFSMLNLCVMLVLGIVRFFGRYIVSVVVVVMLMLVMV